MQYISTRGGMEAKSFQDILIGGLAPDGGLVIPANYPAITSHELTAWRHSNYPDLAWNILQRFAPDIPAADLRELIAKTYTAERFRSTEITPVTPLADGIWLLGLSNGPTLAFKDIAMQLLGNLFEYVLEKTNRYLNILGATSGDTGSSAEYAMLGKTAINVFMLSPYQKMSPFQTAQMFSLDEPNIFNIAVRTVFDGCQDIVKAVSNDSVFKAKYSIGTVNSINWARVAAQVVYYFKAYFAVTQDNSQWVSFAVPSGNFGNICAGHIARQMGLPIHKLILASNENNVLDEFFRTGVYRVREADGVMKTSSPSMDIAKASNFERFIYDVVGRDAAVVRQLWKKVERNGYFSLTDTEYFQDMSRFGLVSGTSTHQDRMETIRRVYNESGIIIDTHTADGLKVGRQFKEPDVPLVCLETALPAKFEESIQEALGRQPERPSGYGDLEQRPQIFVVMDDDVAAVKEYIARQASVQTDQ
jgi:threonine synthase